MERSHSFSTSSGSINPPRLVLLHHTFICFPKRQMRQSSSGNNTVQIAQPLHSYRVKNFSSKNLIVLQNSHHMAEQSKLTIIHLWGLKLN